ncbi:reverse transcriptase domain-containing protein [Tanacetum coccineum]
MLTTLKEREELSIYLAATKEAISTVLMTEREGKQMPVYFVSRALRGSEINYTPMEKLVLALLSASRRLKRYFQAHTIVVITNQLIKQLLSNSEITRRMLRCKFELEVYDIQYRPRISIKGKILADYILERPEEESPDELMTEPEELLEPWTLFTDGSSCIDGSRAGLILTNPEGVEFSYAMRFRFEATNNEDKSMALTLQRSQELNEKSINEKEVLAIVEEEGHTWMTPIFEYLTNEIISKDKKKARAVRRKASRYGYIKNHKKTVKNEQARTRESEEYKKKPKNQSRSQKSQTRSQIQVRKVISRPHSHSSHTSSMVEAQILVGFALYALRKEAQVCLTWIATLAIRVRRSAKDKGKAIMEEPATPKKVKKRTQVQLSMDEELARKMEEEERIRFNAEQEARALQEEEERLNLEAARELQRQLDQRQENKHVSIGQARRNMITYLKNQGGYKESNFKKMSYNDIRPIFERVWDHVNTFIPIGSEVKKDSSKPSERETSKTVEEEKVEEEDVNPEPVLIEKKAVEIIRKTLVRRRASDKQGQDSLKTQKKKKETADYEEEKDELRMWLSVVPDEEEFVDPEILHTKFPIVDWESQSLGNMHVYKIIRADGNTSYHKTFKSMLKIFDRYDLEVLHRLVMERFQDNTPEGYNLMLWGDLKILVDPEQDDDIWKNQNQWKLISWKLYETCGVHMLMVNGTLMTVHLFVEKKYPLTKETL